MTVYRRQFVQSSVGLGVLGLVGGCLGRNPEPEVQVRTAVKSFSHLGDIETALDDEYLAMARYVRTPEGGLGEVFSDRVQPAVADPGDLDPERPTLLFARLTKSGTYEMAGVGWAVSAEDVSSPPSLFGREFHEPTDHHVPGQSDHYGLHAWVFEDNADVTFAPLHPDLTGPSWVDTLEATRDALTQFQAGEESGAERAQEAGYVNTEETIATEEGLYGVPFYDADADGTTIDRPPILLYRITENWFYELLGAEWYIPVRDADSPLKLFGQRFHDPMEPHSPHTDQPEHYGLHGWIFRANPDGMFSLFNPRYDA